jgi:ATP-dependent Lon protease
MNNGKVNKICDKITKKEGDKLTKSELRRLKIELNKNIDLDNSKVLNDINKRCPELSDTIRNIINTENKTNTIKRKLKNNNFKPINKRRRKNIEESNNSLTDSLTNSLTNSLDDDYSLGDETDYDDLYEEVNDLHNDIIDDNFNSLNKTDKNNFNKKIFDIRNRYLNEKVSLCKVISENFNDNDLLWFYKNINKLEDLEGKEKHDLEEKIQNKYTFLKKLKDNDMYNSIKNINDNIIDDILKSHHNEKVKNLLLNRVINITDESIEEYQKMINWVKTILSIPTKPKNITTDMNKILNNLYKNLTTNIYGMNHIIKEILKSVSSIMTDPENNGNVIALVGPPGVGKTTISNLIASSIGMGFGHISCGSINDRATIMGHSSTYIGGKPGLITEILRQSGQTNNVIVLDEMDKLPDDKMIPIFLHILDKSQNNKFKDEYCSEIDIDLSKNMYIVSVNSLDKFDKALKNRLKVIRIDGYDLIDKIEICKNYIIPKVMKRTKINATINVKLIKKCIERISPQKSGVRELERFFGDIYEQLLLIKNIKNNSIVKKFYNKKVQNIDDLNIINKELIENLTDISL